MGTLILLGALAVLCSLPFLLPRIVISITERENKELYEHAPQILFSSYRFAIVCFCYLLSAYGIAQAFVYASSLSHSLALVIVWGVAWSFHLAMSFAWVFNRKLHTFWPICGTFFGILGLLVAPLKSASPVAALPFVAYEIAVVLPCFILALHLVRFHLRNAPSSVSSNSGG